MNVIDSFMPAGVRCVNGTVPAGLLYVLVQHDNGDLQAFKGIAVLPDANDPAYGAEREHAELLTTGIGQKMDRAEAGAVFGRVKSGGEEYRT